MKNKFQADMFDNEIDIAGHIEDMLPMEQLEQTAREQGQVPFYAFRDTFFDGAKYGSEIIAQEMYADYVASQMELSDYLLSEDY